VAYSHLVGDIVSHLHLFLRRYLGAARRMGAMRAHRRRLMPPRAPMASPDTSERHAAAHSLAYAAGRAAKRAEEEQVFFGDPGGSVEEPRSRDLHCQVNGKRTQPTQDAGHRPRDGAQREDAPDRA
jgi:hypothetical protein